MRAEDTMQHSQAVRGQRGDEDDSAAAAAAGGADPRWAAVIARDRAYDGRFVYAVRTTGVYCRPSCASRRARREHVAFYATPSEAEGAGFRACLRCRPNDAHGPGARRAALVAALCRYIERAENTPSLQELARQAKLSPHHLHRLFRAVTGITPAAYAAAKRAERMRAALERSRTVTEAIYDAGFASSGRFYETTAQVLGMTPTRFRQGGAGAVLQFATAACSLGCVLVAASERGICAILLGDDAKALERQLRERFPQATLSGAAIALRRDLGKVVRLIEQPGGAVDLPLDIRGTAFQQRVWSALRAVPAGSTVDYAELARRIGAPRAVRAVAGACAANLLAVAIPCHRALRRDGNLAGYRWGLERKQTLLQRERSLAAATRARAAQPTPNEAPQPPVEPTTPASRRRARPSDRR